MSRRFVPRTYNNRRLLRIILGTAITMALAAVILFVLLFFALEPYWVDGSLQLPWLSEELVQTD